MGRRAAVRDFPPPGTLVDIGGRRIQIDCRGSGSPTVVLVSGLNLIGPLAWSAVHDSLAQTTRTCAYSRAGIMWSDPTPAGVTAKGVADDLHATLARAGEATPFVMVGHSLGGPYIMTYTKHYGDGVAGVVMVDASHPEQGGRMKAVMPPDAKSPSLWPFRIMAALPWTGVPRFMSSMQPPRSNQDSASARAGVAYSPQSMSGALKEMMAFDTILAEAGAFRQLGDRPLFVLTAEKPGDSADLAEWGITAEKAAEVAQLWKTMQEEVASWSTRSQHQLVNDADHSGILFDQSDVVIAAVRSVVGTYGARGHAALTMHVTPLSGHADAPRGLCSCPLLSRTFAFRPVETTAPPVTP
jgi:pimeloyl-ACP methyl ester carboxylesterase